MTYTYATVPVSPAAFTEIRNRLEQAGYSESIFQTLKGPVIDMHGLALVLEQQEQPSAEVVPLPLRPVT